MLVHLELNRITLIFPNITTPYMHSFKSDPWYCAMVTYVQIRCVDSSPQKSQGRAQMVQMWSCEG